MKELALKQFHNSDYIDSCRTLTDSSSNLWILLALMNVFRNEKDEVKLRECAGLGLAELKGKSSGSA